MRDRQPSLETEQWVAYVQDPMGHTNDYNEKARGKWWLKNLETLEARKTWKRYKALKGLFYFSMDLDPVDYDEIWGIYQQPDYLDGFDPTQNGDPRPTLAQFAAGTYSDNSEPTKNYMSERYAQGYDSSTYQYHFRGTDGALFDT